MDCVRVLQIGMHDQIGGVENFIMNYYREIDKEKIQFDFIIPYIDGGYFDEEITSLGGKIFYFSFKNDKNIFKFIKELDNFFANNQYDIVHCNDTGLGFLYLYLAKKRGCKVRIAHSHATSVESSLKGMIKRLLQKIYIKYATDYWACSTEAGKYLFKNRNFKIIKNSIDYEKFLYKELYRNEIRETLNINDTDILIGNIGRFSEQKNQLFLLEILKNLPLNYKCIMIGEGDLESKIKLKIKENNLDSRCFVIGTRKDVYKYYNAIDIFALPSLYEGFPIVGVEAQINGLPCIFSNTITKEIDFNKNAYFLSLNNEDDWCKLIKEVNIKRVKKINDEFSIKFNVKELEKIYLELVNNE